MAVFSLNNVTKVVVIHNDNCKEVKKDSIENKIDIESKNNQWCLDKNINKKDIDLFMKNKHWALRLCATCFEGNI